MKLSQYRCYLKVLDVSDMDISIDLFSHEFVSEKEVAAMARRLPLKVKQAVVKFLEELSRALKN